MTNNVPKKLTVDDLKKITGAKGTLGTTTQFFEVGAKDSHGNEAFAKC